MGLGRLYYRMLHWLGYYDRRGKKWAEDADRRVKIDHRAVELEVDRKLSLHFSRDDARKEESALMPFIDIDGRSRVLDLGCGDGRWGKILAGRCREYIGVDFSKKLLERARLNVPEANAGFVHMPAQEYCVDEPFDLILVIGLLTYLNDEDIVALSGNCRKMLAGGGRLIVRNVSLGKSTCCRQVYNYRPGALLRWLGEPGYQVIRRNREEELSFFKDFRLVHDQPIAGTGYRFYVFE
jgi:2-polyprenyl-3-methyl-5-hydroxy-6-metoxy-1,4-benzoquinol methylase